MADFVRIIERHPDSPRILRFQSVVRALQQIQQRQVVQAVASVRMLGQDVLDSEFDFEAACNMAALLSVLAATSISLPEGPGWVLAIGLRFTNTRGLTELLANACQMYPENAQTLRDCLLQVNKSAETAVAQSLGGDQAGAITLLLARVEATLNTKLLDIAQQMLTRHAARIADAEAHQATIDQLRQACGAGAARAVLGEGGQRKAGELVLRTRTAPEASSRRVAPIAETAVAGDGAMPRAGPGDPLTALAALQLRPAA